MPALYALTEQYRTLVELAFVDEDGALEQEFVAVLSSLVDDIDFKLASICRVVRELERTEEAAKAEATFLALKAKRAASAVERLKAYMKTNLEAIGETKRQVDSVFTVAIQKNPPSLDIVLDLVPTDYDLPPERKIDTTAIKELLKSGESIPGCSLRVGTHLRIK